MTKISIVIPAYRATATLEAIYLSLRQVLDDELAEVIMVYDCGNSETWDAICALSEKYEFVKGIHLTRNYGQHNATICGFEFATGDYIATLDEDLQHDPLELPLLIEKAKKGAFDVVYGTYGKRAHSGFRNTTSAILNKLLLVGIPELNPNYSSFRLIKTEIAKATIGMNNSYTFLDGYLTWITSNVDAVTVRHQNSSAGPSSYSTRKLIEHSINIFVTFSSLPIRLLTYFAVFFFVFSTIYSIVIVANTLLYDDYLPGFPSIIVILGFGFGFTLLGLGIIGEYIQRINLKTTNRPNYKVSKIV